MIFLHTKWSDILTFKHGYSCYLLQGRKNKLTMATSFRVSYAGSGFVNTISPTLLTEEHLDQAGLWYRDENDKGVEQ